MIDSYEALRMQIEDALVRYSSDPRSIYDAAGVALAATYLELFLDAPSPELRISMMQQTLRFLLARLEEAKQPELT